VSNEQIFQTAGLSIVWLYVNLLNTLCLIFGKPYVFDLWPLTLTLK